ncbi:MAG: hypothetical protein NXY57DRAFT_968678 [Lentinula lateritia]|nr:MAG: hypothetical protein NXY57DRAFT_968678 [Lentinula lateritia]
MPLSSINCDADYYHSLCVRSLCEIGGDYYPVPMTAISLSALQAKKDLSITPKPLPSPPLVDFGLADSGAKVGYNKRQMHINPPHVVLEKQLSAANCWKFSGSQGHIAVALLDTILWTDFTFHFPDSLEITEKLKLASKIFVMRALVESENIVVQAHSFLANWEQFVTIQPLLDSLIFNSSMVFIEVARIFYNPSEGSHQTFPTHHPV